MTLIYYLCNTVTIKNILSCAFNYTSRIQVYLKQDLDSLILIHTFQVRIMASKTEELFSQSSILLCIDLQTCYYQPPITELFPKLEQNVRNVLGFCRDSKVQVIHVRQEDVRGVSQWLPWWEELHPDQVDDLGRPSPLTCAKERQTEPVFIKNTFDGFYKTGLDQYLRQFIIIIFLFLRDNFREKNVRTVVVMGLITRACVLNTVMSAFNSG